MNFTFCVFKVLRCIYGKKPCRQDQILILLLYFQSNLVSLMFGLLSYFGFLKASWFAKELYLRLVTDQSILTVIF